MQNVHFTPREIAALLRVNESTVKRWIDRGMLPAIKTAGGHRRIRQEDLAAFTKKHSMNAAKSYVLRRTNKERTAYDWKRYYDAIYHEAYSEALRDLTSLKLAGTDITKLFESIIVPTLVYIGEQWKSGQLGIADEHRMALIIREHIIAIIHLVPEPPPTSPIAVLACVPGENHELILHMIEGTLRCSGIRSVNLGINVPLSELVRTAKKQTADIVCITRGYDNTTGTTTFVRGTAQALPKTLVLFGGRGWSVQDTARIVRDRKNVHRLNGLVDIETYTKKIPSQVHRPVRHQLANSV